MKGIKLIAADMDHTLLTEKGELPPHFKKYMHELDKLGINFAIASGRPMYTLATLFSDLTNKLIFISDNGGAISYKENLLFKSLLKITDYKKMITFTKEKTTGVPILCGLKSAFIEKKDRSYEAFLRTFYAKISIVDNLEEVAIDANKFTVYFPDKKSKKYYEKVFKPLFQDTFSVTVGDTIWIDFMNKEIDKGKAMQILGRKLAIGGDQMMAFGDTYNDIEMLQAVKYSYLVENASADMRKYAKYVTKSNDEFGVTYILKQLIEEIKKE